MLSQRSRYALKAMLHLAGEAHRTCSVPVIAAATNVSQKFLEAILNDLRRGGLVTSARGMSGGYRLARPADEISFGAIMRVTEGPLALVPCASVNFYRPCNDCPDEAACTVRRVLAQARESVAAVLDGTTLAAALAGGHDPVTDLVELKTNRINSIR